MKTQILMEHSHLVTENITGAPKKLAEIPYTIRRVIESELKKQNPEALTKKGEKIVLADALQFIRCRNGVNYMKGINRDYPVIEI